MTSNTNKYGNWYKTEVAKEILSKKYYHEKENFDDFVDRISKIFSAELRPKVLEALYDGDFFPAGRSLYGAGSKGKFKASMSNCYVMDLPKDNIEDIFETTKKIARIFSYGGGCGINISNLRPNGAKVSNAAKTSTGAVSFLNIFNSAGEVIGANNRRAALMLCLDCDHPDVEEFLKVKQNNTAIQSANLSILFTDEFMKAVKDNGKFKLKFKVEATGEVINKTINAKDFFKNFCKVQWDYAEPGALFIDKIRGYNLLSGYPKEEYFIPCTNPCAEYAGAAYNACNLGSINLYNIIDNPFTPEAQVNIDKLGELTKLGVKALDEILDYGYDMQPLTENKQAVTDWRAIGLGIFGLSDALIALGQKYGSKESQETVNLIMGYMFEIAVETSALLAKQKGTFGKYNWEYIKKSLLFKHLSPDILEKVEEYGLRNGSLLSIAPTGSIATMVGMSGGVEPLFQISYERTTHALEKTGKKFKVVAKSVEDLFKSTHPWGIESMDDEEFKKDYPYITTSHEINPLDRIKIQSVMQKYVDNAISSTINLKEEATVNDIFNTYMKAWESGCKGITVFRNNCARTSILGKSEDKESEVFDSVKPKKRRNVKRLTGVTLKKASSCGNPMYITINTKGKEIFEVFTNSSGGCKSNIATITRLASLALRSGVKVENIIEELKENQCPACQLLRQQGRNDISASCGTAIAEAIEEVYQDLKSPIKVKTTGLLKCPKCGENTLKPEGKCFSCINCNYSKCD